MLKRSLLGFALTIGLSLLAACDSAEERAEKHFQAALEHIENKDFDRAAIEFRNVFKLNGRHKEARLTYARIQRERGAEQEAYSQYLRLVEQYPNDLEGRRALAEMALIGNDWAEVERHGQVAANIAPDDLSTRAIQIALSHYKTLQDQYGTTRAADFETAQSLLSESQNLIGAHYVVIDTLTLDQNWPAAREALDAALQEYPDFMRLYTIRLVVLGQMKDTAAIEAQILDMAARFPDDPNVDALLLDWYVSNDNYEAAETYLRSQITPDEEDPNNRVRLISFLNEYRGSEAALAELETVLTTQSANVAAYRLLRAALNYENDNADRAVTELRDILDSDPTAEQADNARITLAKILLETGETDQARALVEEVLASDPRHVEAIKLQAAWLIEVDHPGDAIILLRTALGESPRDAQLMTLLARAHERNGNRDLMAEMLSLAVETSQAAPAETLRYATYLTDIGQPKNAEAILINALRAHPDDTTLLTALGMIYIDQQDWPRLQGIIDRLDDFGADTEELTDNFTAQLLSGQGNQKALQSFLETLSLDSKSRKSVEIELIQSYVRQGDFEAALIRVNNALADTPDDLILRLLQGSVRALDNRLKDAEADFRAILHDHPETEQAWLALYRLKIVQGEAEDAEEVLDQALSNLPGSADLLWIRAGQLERQQDVEGAIRIYETLYAQNSNALLFANNLASLLASHRDDTESLVRAYNIARRLRGSEVPAFQDTYGWIAYRRGDFEEALLHLEPAARNLPNDPTVQYHLAKTYAALDHDMEALEAYDKIIAMNAPEALLKIASSEKMRLTTNPRNSPKTVTGD